MNNTQVDTPSTETKSNYCYGTSSGTTYSTASGLFSVFSDEYPTSGLIDLTGVPYPEWGGGGGGVASCHFEDKAAYPPVRDYSATDVSKVQYRFKVKANGPFEINYRVFIEYDDNTGTNWVVTYRDVGFGNETYYPSVPIEYLPPFKVVMTDGCTNYVGGRKWLEPLCGFADGSSGCTKCSVTIGGTTASLKSGSISVSSSLGNSSYGDHSGSLVLLGSFPTNTLFTPQDLGFSGFMPDAAVVRSGDSLRQVQSAQGLADIVTINSSKYQIRFYTDAGNSNSATGLFEPSGAPFSITTIEQITSTNHLRVTTSNGVVRVYDYDWSPTDHGWTLTSGGGLRKDSSAWNESTLTRTNTIKNSSDQVVLQETRQYLDLSGYGRVIAKQVVGTGSTAQTNLWFYYDNAGTDGTNYGRVKLSIEPSGFWKRYTYDNAGRLTNEVSQFLNAATNAAENLCRVVRYDYASLDGTNNCETRIELLQGVEIAREYTVIYPDVTHHIRCAAAGDSWTNANNLVTKTYYNYDSVDLAGKPSRVISPDGTMQLYNYSDSSERTTTIYSGQPNGSLTAVTNGTKSVTVLSLSGYGVSRSTYDIALGDFYPLESETYGHDTLGRLTTTSYLDGTSTTVNYDCCGLESTVDRDGVTTTYIYDPLHRQVGAMRNNILTTNLLDAAGNVLKTVRVGSNGSTNLLRSAGYDTAGRLLSETNALGGVTSYAQAFDGSGQTVKTNTFPDGGVRIETYYQDGSLKSVTGSAAFPVAYDYGAYTNGTFTKETKGSSGGSEWTKTYSDLLGRSWKTEYADGAASTNFYNTKGQLDKSIDPDGVARLYTYNGLGQTDKTILDVNRNGVGTDSVDRITRSTNDVVEYSGVAARHSRFYQTADNGSEVLASERLVIPALRTSISLNYGLGTTNVVDYPGGQQRAVTVTQPGGSYTVTLYTNGVLAGVTRYDSFSSQLSSLNYSYDSHGRQYQAIDARNGATTYTYNAADQVQTLTTPSPDGVASGLITTTYYDKSLRATNVIQPDATTTRSDYSANGLLQKTWGSRIYPVEYQYDHAGRMTNMITWQDFNESTGAGISGSAATKWLYDTSRGWLSQKKYADNSGPSYTYTAAGRLKSRAWVRGITTWYTNNNAGELWVVNYTDTTPDVTNSYDRRGRLTNVLSGATSLTKVYNDAGNLLREAYSGGPLNGISVTNGYDLLLRRTNLSVLSPSSQLLAATKYGYDNASRLLTVADGPNSATYDYLDNSPLVHQITFATNGTTVMTTTKGYDFLNRLTNTASSSSSFSSSFAYKYNTANQRTSVTNVDGSYWVYSYDSMGQVTSGRKYWGDGTAIAGQQFDYTFDDIGNRKTTTRDTRSATYTPNTLNQYTSRTVPGYVNVLGTATNTATVSLWSKESTALYTSTTRKGDYFRGEVPFNNSTGAMWLTITNVAVLSNYTGADIVTNIVGRDLLAITPEAFGYDADGNLTNDSLWSYTWDAENRLLTQESASSLPMAAKRRLDFTYDHQSRRIQKLVSTNSGSVYVAQSTNRLVYDGWNLVANLNPQSAIVQSFTWGLDLSGQAGAAPNGAGGVGGLLAVYDSSTLNAQPSTHFVAYDANGNVAALVNATNGTGSASYEYGPFGEVLRATGPMAKANPFRFSTKYQDGETDQLYYGYRSYNPSLGRWLNRDPAEYQNGLATYVFCSNRPIYATDFLGLSSGEVLDNWKDLPGKFWEGLCVTIDINGKPHVKDYKTEKINGCTFACCPVPASAFAAVAEMVLGNRFPWHWEKKCSKGKTCCDKHKESVEGTTKDFAFTIETGPHIGENGAVTVNGVDITPILKLGGYQPTTAQTTCKFSGNVYLSDFKFTIELGDCIGANK